MADINMTAEQVAARILAIGEISKLKTTEKANLVAAINSIIDEHLAPESVLFAPQNLNAAEMAQARANIEAEQKEFQIPVDYDPDSGTWSTEINQRQFHNAFESGKKISAYRRYTPLSRDYHKTVFTATELRDYRGSTSGTFVSYGEDGVTVLSITPAAGGGKLEVTGVTVPDLSPLCIRGELTRDGDDQVTFTPEIDYTPEELYNAATAGKTVFVNANGYIIPLTDHSISSSRFDLFIFDDPTNIQDGYIWVRIYRYTDGWTAEWVEV